jgi:hypothetical protein
MSFPTCVDAQRTEIRLRRTLLGPAVRGGCRLIGKFRLDPFYADVIVRGYEAASSEAAIRRDVLGPRTACSRARRTGRRGRAKSEQRRRGSDRVGSSAIGQAWSRRSNSGFPREANCCNRAKYLAPMITTRVAKCPLEARLLAARLVDLALGGQPTRADAGVPRS